MRSKSLNEIKKVYSQKLELIDYIENNPEMSYANIAVYFSNKMGRKVPKPTIYKIYKNREKISKMSFTTNPEICRIKQLDVQQFEKVLANHIETYENYNFTRDKITKIAEKIQKQDFFLDKPQVQRMKFSSSWYNEFLAQNNLVNRTRNHLPKDIFHQEIISQSSN